LPYRCLKAIKQVWDWIRAQSESSPRLHTIRKAAGSASRVSSEQPGAVAGTETEVIAAGVGLSPDGEALEASGPTHGATVLLDSALEPIERTQDRRRRQRKPVPEPCIPVFIKVGPGRYVRAEETSSPSSTTARVEVEADAAPETDDLAASFVISTEDRLLDAAVGPLDGRIGLFASADDSVGDIGIEEFLDDGSSSDDQKLASSLEHQ
jgi:hypothetical protein